MSHPALEIESVVKSYGKLSVLNGVSFAVSHGQSVALWGSNGAGKTTLIRCILGLIDFQGTIRLEGLDVMRHGKRARRLIGYVPQELTLPDDFLVLEAMEFLAKIKKAPLASCKTILADLGLLEHAQKRIRELSGGMKQKLGLSAALLNDPPVLILDEPTSNLDSAARHTLLALLLKQKEAGKTLLFISHRPEEVRGLANRVLTLEYGKVLTDLTAEQAIQAGSDATAVAASDTATHSILKPTQASGSAPAEHVPLGPQEAIS